MTRQKRWQIKHFVAGNCLSCGRPRNLYAHRCDRCALTERRAERRRKGHGPWREGGPGRPPKLADAGGR